jgi:imidazolonepropionase-like amidohydrolase
LFLRKRNFPVRFLPLLFSSLAFNIALAQSAPQATQSAGAVVEHGKFQLHKFEQPIGEETYEISRNADGLHVKIDFKFTDRGTPVPLSATFKAAQDLTPESFEIKGQTARQFAIDQAVEVQPHKIRLRNRDKWSESDPPARPFFTIAGYAPTAMQMLMVRYWATHGSPERLTTLPQGSVRIVPRGQDEFSLNGQKQKLQRYTVEGLIWGRETLWFDAGGKLVTAITTDAEFDHFEAVREGYEQLLGEFVGLAGADGMASLSEISRGISGSRAETLVLVGATLIDGTGGAPVPDSVVVIKGGRIVAAGPRANVTIPKGATVLDETGKTILPGLWDMHAHFEQVEWGPIYLAAGVTTVRDCGNELEFIKAVRDAIAQGRGLGPRLLLAGIVDGTGKFQVGVQRVDTPEQARLWTGKYHDAGFQQMKIYSSMKLEEVQAVAQEAHRLGMTVTGHVPAGLNAFQVIEAGQDQINHLHFIADMMLPPLPPDAKPIDRFNALSNIELDSPQAQEAISFLKKHGTVVDPTLALAEFYTASTVKPPASFEPGVSKVPTELAAPLADVGPPGPMADLREKVFQKQLAIVGALHRAGILIVAGTDQAVPGHSLHREIELYVQAGFTPMEAIQAASLVPARVMGLEKEVGTLETGKRADLIVIAGDPLADIRNTRNVEFVITNGVMYNTAELWRSVGFKP